MPVPVSPVWVGAFVMNLVSTNGAKLATYVEGKGPSIIFLHGGPGDTHHYMKRMANPLFKDFQCIFFDQRGTGESVADHRDPSLFTLDVMIQDIQAIQNFYQTGPAMLVGHSWGAMYGLFACIRNPTSFMRAALLNMGPLDNDFGQRTSQSLLSALTEDEKVEWSRLRQKRNEARERGDLNNVAEADKIMMHLRVKSWIYNPKLHDAFLKDYFQDPPPDRDVNKWVWENLDGQFSWDQTNQVSAKIWLCVGENDSVPVEQALKLKSLLPNGKLSVYEKCGHIPWMEHQDKFYSDLGQFLRGNER